MKDYARQYDVYTRSTVTARPAPVLSQTVSYTLKGTFKICHNDNLYAMGDLSAGLGLPSTAAPGDIIVQPAGLPTYPLRITERGRVDPTSELRNGGTATYYPAQRNKTLRA
jgi:hypothetical protein